MISRNYSWQRLEFGTNLAEFEFSSPSSFSFFFFFVHRLDLI